MNFREFFMAATAYEPFWRQWESPQRTETQLHIDEVALRRQPYQPSKRERDVARRNVQQINSEFFEGVQNSTNIGPSGVELLSHVRLPVGPHIRWKFRTRVEVRAGEIQNEWPFDDGHFEHAQIVVAIDQLRHIESQDSTYCRFSEALINFLLSFVGFVPAQRFDRDLSGLILAFRDQYDTVLARARVSPISI